MIDSAIEQLRQSGVYGHHRYVSTTEDPATAPRGRNVDHDYATAEERVLAAQANARSGIPELMQQAPMGTPRLELWGQAQGILASRSTSLPPIILQP